MSLELPVFLQNPRLLGWGQFSCAKAGLTPALACRNHFWWYPGDHMGFPDQTSVSCVCRADALFTVQPNQPTNFESVTPSVLITDLQSLGPCLLCGYLSPT